MNNLIGITGQKGSGKDTVAIIMNLLSINRSTEAILQYINTGNKYFPVECQYEIKRFAQPIKDFVANILGVPVDKLEDRDFKEKELGEEWDYVNWWEQGSGAMVIEAPKHFNNTPFTKEDVYKTTPRSIMQLIGTEVCRQIHPNFWVNSLFKDYLKGSICNCIRHEESNGCFHCDYSGYDITPSKWIISDCRFDNEAKAIKDRGGIIIRVNKNVDNTDTHASETGILDKYVDIEIDNNGTIENLITKVKTKVA